MAPHKGIETRYAEGDRSMLVDPFDYILMEMMPEEGANFANLYQIGITVTEIKKKLKADHDAVLSSGQISSRLNTLARLKLIRKVSMLSGRGISAWQQTVEGKKEVDRWQSQRQA